MLDWLSVALERRAREMARLVLYYVCASREPASVVLGALAFATGQFARLCGMPWEAVLGTVRQGWEASQ